jgi:deoxyribodipyrimidine photo-lyase
MDLVPDIRIRLAGTCGDFRTDGEYVLYWMIANRRCGWNFSLQRAADWAQDLKKPLVVFEPLRCGYRWASDRLHRFVIQGMADNQRRFQQAGVFYYPYLEPKPGDGAGLLHELAARACVVVSDDFPCFFLPRMINSAARQVPVRFELIDSNGLLPMRATNRVFARAFDFRRFLQRELRPHLDQFPDPDPLHNRRLPKLRDLPPEILQRWRPASPQQLLDDPTVLSALAIDHAVGPTETIGGQRAAGKALQQFLDERIPRYAGQRNEPEVEAASGLSPYLHFGHISAHQVFAETMSRDGWSSDRISAKVNGSSEGWWGASANVESFVDELITWREIGYNLCWQREDYDRYESLPDWAQTTLAEHAGDRRPHVYRLAEFEAAETHDPLWNAAQRQLVREGRIHNYLRMLWGKKVFEWSASPREALATLIELNNKYALDGRNPNSYSGIFWVLGRYDRAWGPERPIFGKIRYMTSENTARKVRVKDYIRRYSEA